MAVQTVFQRYEMKYLLTQAPREAVLRALEPHMALDPYGRTVIRNLYLDTESYRLIRRSIEKPVYKEKMRIRCYGPAHPDSPVFVELKKKYKKVVYKRRLSLPEREAMDWVLGRRACRPARRSPRRWTSCATTRPCGRWRSSPTRGRRISPRTGRTSA